ncbi:ABC transporter ATP-binding protein/permease [bacterium 210820-DFI.6.52]|nr:ABC transporter ATP-binding protein/permease [bacterium 210820-DFI.6.52]
MQTPGGHRRPSGSQERPRDTRYTLRRLWGYLCRHRWMLLAAAALALASNLLALLGPMLSGLAIDAIGTVPGQVDFPRVFFYAGWMLAFYLLSALLGYLLSLLMIRLSQRVVRQMRGDLFSHLMDLPVRYFDSHQTGDIVSRISYDIDTVNTSLSSDLLQIGTSAITVVGSFGMMLAISPALLAVFAVTVPLSILWTRYMTRKVRPLFSRRSAELGALGGLSEEAVSGLRTVKAYSGEEAVTARFDAQDKRALDAQYAADYYGTMTGPSVNFINNLSLTLVSVLGATLFLFGKITLGNLSSFVLYSRKFSGPINEIANIASDLQSAFAAAERVFRLIDEPSEPADAPDALPAGAVRGEVELDRVSFGYDPTSPVLKDFSLRAPPGSLVAIVGPTGAGKTTVINLLMRFYDPQSGEIRLDGRETRRITRDSLRRCYTLVLQDTWLFSGTIAENIAYARPDATREEVVAAAKAAHIHRFISQLPQGYDTLLTGDEAAISRGQKQMLTIARAMLLQSNMLILDEATSNVDTRTERRIQGAMRQLMEGRTCFVIAHRLSTIQNADVILVVKDGRVVEQGDHASLLQRGGAYAELYWAQFQ